MCGGVPAHPLVNAAKQTRSRVRLGKAVQIKSPLLADFVAKRFCVFERATLIQDQASLGNIDSKNPFSRFDCCAFLLASYSSPTFATKSARSRRILQCSIPSAIE
jgi:hypothetical protein